MGADGLSVSAANVVGGAGLSQSQGSDFESWGEEEGFLHAAGVLSKDGGEWKVKSSEVSSAVDFPLLARAARSGAPLVLEMPCCARRTAEGGCPHIHY